MAGRYTAYVETTIPSYLTSRASRDIVVAAHQRLTREWWLATPERGDLFVSQTVINEITRGDPDLAAARIAILQPAEVLPYSPDAIKLAADYLRLLQLPGKAANDALHLAYATIFEMDYLVTWNMLHLANSLTMRRLTGYNSEHRLHIPLVVTPEYLVQMEAEDEDNP